MLEIFKKDLVLLFSDTKQRVFMLIVVPVLLLVIDTNRMDELYFMIVVVVSHTFMIGPFYHDVQNSSNHMIASLPINRREIVIYKYLGVFVYLFISIVYVGIYLWIINKIGLLNVDYFNLSMLKKVIPYILLSMSIILPINFKLGTRYINMINMFINMGVIILASVMAASTVEGNPIKLVRYLESPIFLLVVGCVFILSMIISIKLYENMDL